MSSPADPLQPQQQTRPVVASASSHSRYQSGYHDDDDIDDEYDSATSPLSSTSLASSSFPAAPLRRGVSFPTPPDHLLLSILVLFLCCPFGAVAVIKSLEAQAARERGHGQTALVNAALAKRWALLGLTLGLIFNFFGLMMIMIYLCQSDIDENIPVYQ